MLIKQISIFLENKSGRLAKVTKILNENNIDIRALSVADTTDFGILRLIVNDPDKAEKKLKESGFMVSCTSVIAIALEDKPGGLNDVLEVLDKEAISIEYMYAFVGKSANNAYDVFKVEDEDKALEVLERNNLKVLSPKELYEM